MNILVTNDDGIKAEGIKQLVDELCKIGDVYVVAPEGERSATSHHISIKGSVRFEEVEFSNAKKAFAVWGTPADCVHCGLHILLEEKVDLLVSGINRGPNLSSDIIYSGTVAAAREGFIQGVPSMAVSLCDFNPDNYYVAAEYSRELALKYLELEDNRDYFISVNIPNVSKEEIRGVKICDNIAKIVYEDSYRIEKEDGISYIKIMPLNRNVEHDCNDMTIDLSAVEANYISISPLGNMHISRNHIKSVEKLIK